ncbi:MAG: Ig-like domain-containing protein [Oscillospiraceae bacterium]|nr:Ig-like domain-containing protein [Oscillospiraceae bacterium]
MSVSDRLQVRAAAESRVGNARGNNEDNVYFNGDFITPHTIRQDFAIKTGEPADMNCFAVFDGMGRNNTGSYASLLGSTRLDELTDRLSYEQGSDVDGQVLRYIQQVNGEVRDQIKETGGVRTATTMGLVIIENGTVHAYNAGDSRIYLFRDRNLMQLSRDHVSASGQRSVVLSDDNVRNGGLTKYLGITAEEGELEPYRAKPFKLKKGDKILICSDGVTDYVDDEMIAACLSKRKDPFGHTNELMKSALAFNSADNLSVVVIEAAEPGFHITQNMINVAVCVAVFLLGLTVGILFGYVAGGAGAGRKRGRDDSEPLPAADFSAVGSYLGPGSDSDVSGSGVSGSDGTGGGGNTLYPTTTAPTAATKPIFVESFEINTSSKDFTISVGKTQKIGFTVVPNDLDKYITWTSDDLTKVTVDEFGFVTAVAPGRATITAKVGDMKGECIVRVK